MEASSRASQPRTSKTDDFDFHALLDFVLALEEFVDSIERRGVVVALSAFLANLGVDVLYDIELAVDPVVLVHLLFHGVATAELAGHSSSVKA